MTPDSILLYNLYVRNNWRAVTDHLLATVPHQALALNVTADVSHLWKVPYAIRYVRRALPGRTVQTSVVINRGRLGEVFGFERLRRAARSGNFRIATYCHSKGVTKPGSDAVADWREYLRYFTIERHDICREAFAKGYILYGVNLMTYNPSEGERLYAFKHSDFHLSGNFVSANLTLLGDSLRNTPLDADYYGVEAFWGKLCPIERVFCPFRSNINHYKLRWPGSMYKGSLVTVESLGLV